MTGRQPGTVGSGPRWSPSADGQWGAPAAPSGPPWGLAGLGEGASHGSVALSLQPLHLQDLAQNLLHIFVHLALEWEEHRENPGDPATVQVGKLRPGEQPGAQPKPGATHLNGVQEVASI